MFKIIAAVVIILIAAVLIFTATRPNNFRVQRSASIKAPPEKLFALINDFHQWEAWSPWEKVDPAVKRTYSGAASGKGAVYEWSGNSEIGQGRIEIIESSPFSRLVLNIDFIKPYAAHNTIEFILVQQGDSTTVTQAMYGPSSFIHKLMGIIFSMDKMIGQKYEQGFANMQAMVEQ
jgi:uncharacterized protein YndB with AHSA1/START domain